MSIGRGIAIAACMGFATLGIIEGHAVFGFLMGFAGVIAIAR
jgi:hypothetical protein